MKKILLAHRGYSFDCKENTIKSFENALEHGFDGVEIDVRITKDNVLVLTHDESLKREYKIKRNVSEKTLEELRKDTQIPTFKEFLNRFNGKFEYVNIDFKLDSLTSLNSLFDILSGYESNTKYILSSFNPNILNKAKQINNKIETALLISDNVQFDNIELVQKLDWISILDKFSKDKDLSKYNVMIWSQGKSVSHTNGQILIQDIKPAKESGS